MTMMRIIICTHFTYNYNNGNWLNLWFTEGCNTTRTCYIYVALYKNNFTFFNQSLLWNCLRLTSDC